MMLLKTLFLSICVLCAIVGMLSLLLLVGNPELRTEWQFVFPVLFYCLPLGAYLLFKYLTRTKESKRKFSPDAVTRNTTARQANNTTSPEWYTQVPFAVGSHALAISGVIYYLLLLPTPMFWSRWQFWAGFLLFCPLESITFLAVAVRLQEVIASGEPSQEPLSFESIVGPVLETRPTE
jgi:hypothetical protein